MAANDHLQWEGGKGSRVGTLSIRCLRRVHVGSGRTSIAWGGADVSAGKTCLIEVTLRRSKLPLAFGVLPSAGGIFCARRDSCDFEWRKTPPRRRWMGQNTYTALASGCSMAMDSRFEAS